MQKFLVPIMLQRSPRWYFHVKNPMDESGFERKQEKYQGRFWSERPRDYLFTTIQYDICILLFSTRGRETGTNQDKFLKNCIMRVNLDEFWARDTSTTYRSYIRFRKNILSWKKLVIYPKISLLFLGTFTMKEYVCGYGVAINMV